MNLIRMALTCFLRCCSPFFEASLTRRLPGLLRCSSSTETEVVSGGRRVVICQRLVFEAHGLLYNTPGPSRTTSMVDSVRASTLVGVFGHGYHTLPAGHVSTSLVWLHRADP